MRCAPAAAPGNFIYGCEDAIRAANASPQGKAETMTFLEPPLDIALVSLALAGSLPAGVDVRTLGVKGDGTADDTAALLTRLSQVDPDSDYFRGSNRPGSRMNPRK